MATLWKLFFLHFVAKKSVSFIATHVWNDVLIGANNQKSKTEIQRPKNFTVSYCYLNHCFPIIKESLYH